AKLFRFRFFLFNAVFGGRAQIDDRLDAVSLEFFQMLKPRLTASAKFFVHAQEIPNRRHFLLGDDRRSDEQREQCQAKLFFHSFSLLLFFSRSLTLPVLSAYGRYGWASV